jgi:aminopeptidase
MAPYDPAVSDGRLLRYAELLVGRCIAPEPGWQVLVATTTEARPLAEELSRRLARRGAYALPRIAFGAVLPLDAAWIAAAPPRLAGELPPLEQEVVDRVDGAIFVLAPEDPPADADFSHEARAALRAQFSAYRRRGRAGAIREVRCDFPCAYFARRAGLSLAEYEAIFYAACLRDWDEEGRRMRPVLERFDRASEVRIVGEGTDLTLSLAGRRGAIDDGRQNVPGGEVFYSPVEDSAEGVVRFDFPSGRVDGVRLVFRRGEVVEASAATGDDALRVGELCLGCNAAITRHLRNVLFDEKMAGTIHLALGAGFPKVGGRNESALHWDLVKDMRPGGRILCDGEVVQADGEWRL